eukprot:TRINITY_DN10010_c0_g1_i2.p1 TRINITY_DN10010_c0_g1~~TRINITY_DN10010_c0_g1_i2.p1  ORF type:complete len:1740 (+),score=348.94 TRINITY_DN10010_c0_g1_i2:145-5364(+)
METPARGAGTLESIVFVDQSRSHLRQGGHITLIMKFCDAKDQLLRCIDANFLGYDFSLHADGYSSNGMLIDLGLACPLANTQPKRISVSVVVQLVSSSLAPGSNNVDLRLVPRCSVGCCQRPLEAPNTIKPGSTLSSKPDPSRVVSITSKGELSFCARVLDIPAHVGMTHFNLLVRAIDRSALAATGTPPLPTTLISSDFVVFEKKSKPLRWLQLRSKLAARDEDLLDRSSWTWPPNTTYATLPPDRTVIPDYAFVVRWVHEYCLSSSTSNTPDHICAISKRVLRLFPGVLESVQESPESLAALENSFVDACTYALENVGTESTDELQAALLRIIVDAVASGPAELLSIARFRDINGLSLLHHTAILGYLRVATAALSWSADPDALDIDGNSALLYAAEGGFKNFCLTLVQKGAKIDQSNMFEETPLIVATREKKAALHDILTRSATPTATPSPPKTSSAAALLAEASTAPLPPPLFQSPSVSATTSPVTSPPTSPPLSPRGSSKQKKNVAAESKSSGSGSSSTVAPPAAATSSAPADTITLTKSSDKLNVASGSSNPNAPSKGISSFFSRLGRSDKTTPPPEKPSTPTPASPAAANSGVTTPNPSTPTQAAPTGVSSSPTSAGSGDEKSDKEPKSKAPAIVTPLNLSGSIIAPVAGTTSPLVSPVAQHQPQQQQQPREDSDTGSDSGPPVSSTLASPPSPSVTPSPAPPESGGILSLFALGGSKKEKDKEKEREREKEKEKEREKLLKEKEKEKEREREKQKEKERKEKEERERKEKEKLEKEMKRLKEREKKEKEKKEREEKEKKEKEEKERKEKERKERERVEKEQKKQQQLQEKEKKEKERKDKEKLSIPAIATGGQPGGPSAIAAGASSKLAPKASSKKPSSYSKSRKSDKKPGSRQVSIQRPSSSRRPAKKTDGIPISMRALSLERSSSDSDDSDEYFNAKEAAAIARSEQIKALILSQPSANLVDRSRRPNRPSLFWSVSYIMRQHDNSISLKRRLVPRSRSWNSLNRSSLAAAKSAFSQKQGSPTERRKRSASSGASNAKRMIGPIPPPASSDTAAPASVTTAPTPRLFTLMKMRKPLSSLLAEPKPEPLPPASSAPTVAAASASSSTPAPTAAITDASSQAPSASPAQPKPVRPKASTLRPSGAERDPAAMPLSTSTTPQSILLSAATLRPSVSSVALSKAPSTWEEHEAFFRAQDEAIMKELEMSLEADITAAKVHLADAQVESMTASLDEPAPGSILVNEVNRYYERADPERLFKEDADVRNALRVYMPDASEDLLSLASAAQFNAKLPYSVFTRRSRRCRDENWETNLSNDPEPDPLLIFAAPHETARMIHGESVMKEFEIFRTSSSNPDPRELFAPVQGLGYGIYGQKYSYLATNDASKYDLDVVDEAATPLPLIANEVAISRIVSSHPNILKIYSAIYQADPPEGSRRRPPGMGSSKTPLVWTVSEHTGGGTLKQLLDAAIEISSPTFPEEFIAYVVKKIIYALIYLHEEKRVLHRFLAPIFVRFTAEGQVKVAMSTMSVQLADVSRRLSVHDDFNDVHIDIWSLGWLILHMVTRDRAWFETSPHVVAYMPNRPSPSTVAEKVSPELYDFLKYCLIEPQSASTLLLHPFLIKAFGEEKCALFLQSTFGSLEKPPPNVTLLLNQRDSLKTSQMIPLSSELESESPFELPPILSDSPPPPPAEPEPDSDDPDLLAAPPSDLVVVTENSSVSDAQVVSPGPPLEQNNL